MGISAALGSSALLPAGLGFRNKIINGDFRVWQRGTPVTATIAYTADRWVQVSGNSIVHDFSTDTPNSAFQFSLSMAGTGSNIAQRIESLNCGGINGTITVSFWYKSTAGSDSLSMSLYTCNTANSFGSVTQVGSNVLVSSSPSNSWTYYSYTFSGVSSNSKNGIALYIFRGSNSTSTTLITGVQVEANAQPTPFEQRPIGVELALCQRYFYIIPINGITVYNPYWNVGLSGGGQWANYNHPVEMRITPVLRNSTGGTSFAFGYSRNDAGANFTGNLAEQLTSNKAIATLLYSSVNNGGAQLGNGGTGFTGAINNAPIHVSAEL